LYFLLNQVSDRITDVVPRSILRLQVSSKFGNYYENPTRQSGLYKYTICMKVTMHTYIVCLCTLS